MGEEGKNKDLSALYLGSLRVEGYRGFKDNTQIEFTQEDGSLAQWTVILGENGTSKTGLLQAVAALAPTYDQTLAREAFALHSEELREDEPLPGWRPRSMAGPEWIAWWCNNLPRNREHRLTAVNFAAQFCTTGNGLGSAVIGDEDSFLGVPKAFTWRAGIRLEETATQEIIAKFEFMSPKGKALNKFQIFGYGASRLVERNESRSINRKAADSLFSEFDLVDSPEQWLIQLDHAMRIEDDPSEKDKAERSLESAKRCICAVLPDIEDVKIGRVERTFATEPTVRAKFKCPYGWVFFEELGQGYQSMASWAVDLLQQLHRQYSHLEKPETGAAVVLIDEFDLHLHPKWQMTLMEDLGNIFSNTQFIVTAHSPLLVQAADTETNLVVLKKERDENGINWIVADSDPVHVRGWRLDQIITSDLFGLSSARPKPIADLFKKWADLVAKERRTASEEEELKLITSKLETEAPATISTEAKSILEKLSLLE